MGIEEKIGMSLSIGGTTEGRELVDLGAGLKGIQTPGQKVNRKKKKKKRSL